MLSDDELVEQILLGNENAAEELIKRYYTSILRYCRWHCSNLEKAEDLIPTLEEAFRQDVPSVIVVPVDYSENMKLSEHLKEVYTKKQEAII